MTTLADPIEQRDAWRTVWQIFTGDATMIALCIIVASGVLAALVLPQTPTSGTADPIAYSQWEAQAKLIEGSLYDALSALGLNNAMQTAWWRIALALLAMVTGLRLADRIVWLFALRRPSHALRDELRIRVAFDAPDLNAMAAQLQSHRYRVAQSREDVLIADRTPIAEAFSIALHAGLLIAIAGILLTVLLGWSIANRSVVAGQPLSLPGDHELSLASAESEPVHLMLQPGEAAFSLSSGQSASVNGVVISLRQITPGYRLSATDAAGKPVLIRASNFVSPTTEVLLTFGQDEFERYVAVPEAGVALALSAGGQPDQPGALRVFAMPQGTIVTETILTPDLSVNDVTFRFTPARGAIVAASYRPGDALIWAGLGLMLIGLIGASVHPMRRIVVRHHGHWTEFYARGRGVRRVVNQLSKHEP